MSPAPLAESPAPETDFDRLLDRNGLRWQDCEGHPESTLLRLALLREIAQQLHRDISSNLAAGQKDQAKDLRARGELLERLRTQKKLAGDLPALLRSPPAAHGSASSRTLPEGLFRKLEREKFERYDRQWEAALASEACALGWKVWALEASVEITDLERWAAALAEVLWPNGIVLFVEASESSSFRSNRWKGRWIIALHGTIADPQTRIAIESAPGEIQWRLVYSP